MQQGVGSGGVREQQEETVSRVRVKNRHQTDTLACNHQGTDMKLPKRSYTAQRGPDQTTNPSARRIYYYGKIIRKSRKNNRSISQIRLKKG